MSASSREYTNTLASTAFVKTCNTKTRLPQFSDRTSAYHDRLWVASLTPLPENEINPRLALGLQLCPSTSMQPSVFDLASPSSKFHKGGERGREDRKEVGRSFSLEGIEAAMRNHGPEATQRL